MDKGKLPVSIYLDLSKAFDTLDFNILLDKLRHYGIKGNENKLFENYLQNRQQFVVWDSSTSDLKTIKTGVPQGSVLGPLLFLIYLNDISNASELFNFISYADDSTLSGSLSLIDTQQTDNINSHLDKISEWLKVNKLTLNEQKTKFMIFYLKK